MLRDEDRKAFKEFLGELRTKWFESLDSYMQTTECLIAAKGWDD